MQLPKHLEIKFRNELQAYEEATHIRYITSIERIGMEKGMEKGLQQGALRQLLRLLQHRFQTMPEAVQIRLNVLPVEQLEQLLDVALSVTSITEFADHLPEPADNGTEDTTE